MISHPSLRASQTGGSRACASQASIIGDRRLSDDSVAPALREVKDRIDLLYARRDAVAVLVRWEIGEQVLQVRDGPQARYGREGVETLARALKRSDRSLYRHANVAEQWSRQEIDELMQRRRRGGRPLRWTHFTALIRDDLTAEERRLWISRALAWGLSPKRMSELIDESKGIDRIVAADKWLKAQWSVERQADRQVGKLEELLDFLPKGKVSLLAQFRLAQYSFRRLAVAFDEADRRLERFLKTQAPDLMAPDSAPSCGDFATCGEISTGGEL